MRFRTTAAQVPIRGSDILVQPRQTIGGHFRGAKHELEIVLNFHKNGSLFQVKSCLCLCLFLPYKL